MATTIYAVLRLLLLNGLALAPVQLPGYEGSELRSVMSWVRQRKSDQIPPTPPYFVAAEKGSFFNSGDEVIGGS